MATDMTLDDFVVEETKRLALFAAYWRAQAEKGERADTGDVMWPDAMPAGHWDEQYLAFDVVDAEQAGFTAVDTPQGFVVHGPKDTTTA